MIEPYTCIWTPYRPRLIHLVHSILLNEMQAAMMVHHERPFSIAWNGTYGQSTR